MSSGSSATSQVSSSILARYFSREEPMLFCNFDVNPNTSVFCTAFLAATILQILGFYVFRRVVPRLSKDQPKEKRALSWVLTLFSSIVLFTGTFMLSSNMEWSRPEATKSVMRPMLSLHNFPRESDVATMYSAYFVSYLICDLVLGMIYYRAYLDPLSGWFHHLGYLAVVSNAALQKNVSTLFAIGTPIEVSTIFLASGHIFPHLRSDFMFATSFFLSRIVYPIVLLPELYLNVESRLCWKVGATALLVHIHWFRKFVQQQLRYYRGRKELQQASLNDTLEMTSKTERLEESLDLNCKIKEEHIVHDYVPSVSEAKVSRTPAPSPPETLKNNMSGMSDAVVNAIEVNGSGRHHFLKAVRQTPSRPGYDPLFFKSTSLTRGDEPEQEQELASVDEIKSQKTMQQLLEECDQEEFAYPLPIEGLKGNNKTFSALALKRMMSSQSSTNGGVGAVRLSRASSVRDAKRRIGLDTVRFEESSESQILTPVKEQAKCQSSARHQKQQGLQRTLDEKATVVLRKKPSRVIVAPKSNSQTSSACEYDFGTIRVARGVAVNA
ncbi:hypothetical protein BGX28_008821 [Mortierella sp. GBA30]|nr:hypothetical protein BGX28_008821 [Mortierella sp. GBA30]